MNPNPLSIIIPSKNAENLAACMASIRNAGETSRVIIVDDGINTTQFCDLYTTAIGRFDVRIGVQPGLKPFCYARNINLGIAAAGTDDVLLLNDDTLLKSTVGISRLHRIAMERPEFGIIGAACNNVGNPRQNLFPELAEANHVRTENRTLCFTAVLIPRFVLATVGPLDERFVDYGMDDDDYSLRARNAGFQLGIFDGCYFDHGSLTSSYRGGPEAGGDFTPNLRRFIAKWGFDNWGRARQNSPYSHLWPEGE